MTVEDGILVAMATVICVIIAAIAVKITLKS